MIQNEPVIIVPQSAVERGIFMRRILVAGWVFGLLALLTTAFMAGQVTAYHKATKEMAVAREQIAQLQAQQVQITAALAKAWEDQRNGINLVTSWASYIKDREDLVHQNKKNEPDNAPHLAFRNPPSK